MYVNFDSKIKTPRALYEDTCSYTKHDNVAYDKIQIYILEAMFFFN